MIQTTLNALVEPRRREIIMLVHRNELTSSAIAAYFDISASAVSQHLKVLVESGLVTVRREGSRRYYRLRKVGFADVKAFIDQFWDDALFLLKETAEEEERKKHGGN
jgi:DNA-binding transcriptional ArsR family regulator